MKWAVLAARVLVGLMFTVFGLNFFLKFATIPPPPSDSLAMTYLAGIMIPSGYLAAVKLLEIVGGILLLSGRMAPLGITILTPIALNVLFYELFLLKAPGPGVVLFALCAFLVYGYRSHFASVFTTSAKVG
jgi:putative oxidoreductase